MIDPALSMDPDIPTGASRQFANAFAQHGSTSDTSNRNNRNRGKTTSSKTANTTSIPTSLPSHEEASFPAESYAHSDDETPEIPFDMHKILSSTLNHMPTFTTDNDEADLNSFHEEAANDFPSFDNYVHAEREISHASVSLDEDATVHPTEVNSLSPSLEVEVEDEEETSVDPGLNQSQKRGRPKSRAEKSKIKKVPARKGRSSYRQDIGILPDHSLPTPTFNYIQPLNPKPYVLQNVERLQSVVEAKGDKVEASDWMALEAAKREAEKAISAGSDPLVAQGLVSKALKYHETSSRLCKLLTTERKFAQAEINFLMTLKEHVHNRMETIRNGINQRRVEEVAQNGLDLPEFDMQVDLS